VNKTQTADVLLLSAGYGKRLGEVTKTVPKPLVEMGGKKLIEWNLELLKREGFSKVFVNVFYLQEKMREFLGDGSRWGLKIEIVEEPVLLDTGGAIKNIESRLQCESLITINSDTVLGPDFSLQALLSAHRKFQCQKTQATLVLRSDSAASKFGELGIDSNKQICSFLGKDYKPGKVVSSLMYCGVQVLSRTLFASMPPVGSVFSITRDTYKKVLENQGVLTAYEYDGYWSDLGTPESLEQASKEIRTIFGIP